MSEFNPVKTPVADFPFPVGSAVRGSHGSLYVVADHEGFAFLACCTEHEAAGRASGFPPATDNGRLLVRDLEAVGGPPPVNCGCESLIWVADETEDGADND